MMQDTNIPKVSIIENVYNHNKNHMAHTALIYTEKKISYAEFFQEVSIIAEAFKSLGIKRGDIVTLMPLNTPEFMYAYYALNKIGAIANSIHPLSSERDINNYLNEVDSKYVICSDANCLKLNDVLKEKNSNSASIDKKITGIIAPFSNSTPLGVMLKSARNKQLVEKSRELKQNSKIAMLSNNFIMWNDFRRKGNVIKNKFNIKNMKFEGKSDDVAVIVHTGGTTGVPKGVKLTNKNGVALVQNHIEAKELCNLLKSNKTLLGNISMYTAFGFFDNLNVPLTLGIPIHLEPLYSPETFIKDICNNKPNIIFTVPAFLETFCDYIVKEEQKGNHIDVSNLDLIIIGGQKMTTSSLKNSVSVLQSHQNKSNKIVIDTGYGSSETTAAATCTIFDGCNKEKVGKPFKYVNIKVMDLDTNEELPNGEIGEIVISGPTVMEGYYNMPEETENVLKKDCSGNVMYYTGDVGYIDKNGEVDIIGRKRKMITMFNGYKIASPAIEEMVETLPEIKDCVIVPMKDPFHPKGEVPKAYVSLNSSSKDDIESKVKGVVSKNMNERNEIFDVKIVDEIPLTKMGKKDFKAIEILELLNNVYDGVECSIKSSTDSEYDYLCEIKNFSNIDNNTLCEILSNVVSEKEKNEGIKEKNRKAINYSFIPIDRYSDFDIDLEKKCKVPVKKHK